MKSYKLLHQLVDLVEKFEGENNNQELSLQDFTGFLINRVSTSEGETVSSEHRFGDAEQQAQNIGYQLDNNISRLVIFMSRYAKWYIKKALDGTPLQTAEEFTCLAILLTHTDVSKKDLISHNLQEKTSGTEVIRRLIGSGLATQLDDVNDKRSKRISITPAGKDLLYKVFIDTSNVGKVVTGDLTVGEKYTLNYLLQRLETFHQKIHRERAITSKTDLAEVAKKSN